MGFNNHAKGMLYLFSICFLTGALSNKPSRIPVDWRSSSTALADSRIPLCPDALVSRAACTHTLRHTWQLGVYRKVGGGGAPKWFLHPPENLRADASLGRLQQKKKTKEMRTQKKKTKRTKKKRTKKEMKKKTKEMRTQKKKTKRTKKKRTKKEMKKKTKEMRTKKEKKKTKEVRTHTGKEKKKEKKSA